MMPHVSSTAFFLKFSAMPLTCFLSGRTLLTDFLNYSTSEHLSPKSRFRANSFTSIYSYTPACQSYSSSALAKPGPDEYDYSEFTPTADVFDDTPGVWSSHSIPPTEPPMTPVEQVITRPLLPHELVALSKEKRRVSESQPTLPIVPFSPPSPIPRASSADQKGLLLSRGPIPYQTSPFTPGTPVQEFSSTSSSMGAIFLPFPMEFYLT